MNYSAPKEDKYQAVKIKLKGHLSQINFELL